MVILDTREVIENITTKRNITPENIIHGNTTKEKVILLVNVNTQKQIIMNTRLFKKNLQTQNLHIYFIHTINTTPIRRQGKHCPGSIQMVKQFERSISLTALDRNRVQQKKSHLGNTRSKGEEALGPTPFPIFLLPAARRL